MKKIFKKKLSPLVCAIERVLVVRHADHHLNNYQRRQEKERETWQDGKLLSKHGKRRRRGLEEKSIISSWL